MTAADSLMDGPTAVRQDVLPAGCMPTGPRDRPADVLAEEVRAEGWGWVEVQTGSMAFDTRRYGLAAKAEREPTDDELQMLMQLQARWVRLVDAYRLNEQSGDPHSEAYCAEEQRLCSAIDEIEDRMEVAHQTLAAWSAEQMARLGAILCIDATGEVLVHRGLYRKGHPAPTHGEAARPRRHAFSEDLMRDLSAHRTAAIQATLMRNIHVALVTLVHRLCETLFDRYGQGDNVVKVHLQPTSDAFLSEDATGYDDSPAAWLLHRADTEWSERLPNTSETLFVWLLAQDPATLLSLLAYCTARSFHAVSGAERSCDHSDAIANAVDLDMADWWMPTAENFLGRVTRRQAARAVHEATGVECTQAVFRMRRTEVAPYCARQLEGTRWLPAPLRTLPRTSSLRATPSAESDRSFPPVKTARRPT